MEYQYIKAMEEFDLSFGELPEDAQTGIEQIKDVEKAINMLNNRGKRPTEKTLKKLRAMDKWVYYEILDYVNDTDKNDDEMPYDDDEIINELEGGNNVVIPPYALRIEDELKSLYDSGTKSYSIDQLKSSASSVYDVIFDGYDPDEENGVQTSNYSLIEKNDNLFHISKI
jgi:hypothetical protein